MLGLIPSRASNASDIVDDENTNKMSLQCDLRRGLVGRVCKMGDGGNERFRVEKG